MGSESGAAPRNGGGVSMRDGAVINGPGGRLTASGQLTTKQRAFVKHVAKGMAANAAAELAGYTSPDSEAWRLTQIPHVRAAIHAERDRILNCDIANLALDAMRELITDKDTLASVRFQASKFVLETAGHRAAGALPGLPGADQPLEELSLDALQRFIAAGEAALASLKVIDGQAVRLDSTQDSAQLDD